jgi:hypothetical protein
LVPLSYEAAASGRLMTSAHELSDWVAALSDALHRSKAQQLAVDIEL